MTKYLAIDLGAESGRVMLGELSGGQLRLRELHRFANAPVKAKGTLRWDVIRLWNEIQVGLRAASTHAPIRSLACDSWGVDYVLLDRSDSLLGLPYTYRDPRTASVFAEVHKQLGPSNLYAATGIGSYSINTLYQLVAEVRSGARALGAADRLLLIADYFNWMMSGVSRAETTLASTTQCWDAKRRRWAWPLLKRLSIPSRIFPRTIEPGSVLGGLLPEVAARAGLQRTAKGTTAAAAQVVATCSHDTACAVVATASAGRNWAYLSSGTWSLLGVELPRPIVTEAARIANFTNEAGFAGTTRFLKCLVGLWILQECRRDWRGAPVDYSRIVTLARTAQPLRSLIRPDDPRFATPGAMTKKIQTYCRETNQPIPATRAAVSRCIFESLALLYKMEIDTLESLTGRTISTLHIVGGGSQNPLLNQLTANAIGRRVVAGPVEATAAGNILVQAIAMGDLPGIAAARTVMRRSFTLKTFEPSASARSVDSWHRARDAFAALPDGKTTP